MFIHSFLLVVWINDTFIFVLKSVTYLSRKNLVGTMQYKLIKISIINRYIPRTRLMKLLSTKSNMVKNKIICICIEKNTDNWFDNFNGKTLMLNKAYCLCIVKVSVNKKLEFYV